MTVRPPVLPDVKATLAEAFPAVATPIVGVPGSPSTLIEFDAADGEDGPTELVVVTVQVWGSPRLPEATVTAIGEAPALVPLSPSEPVAVASVTVAPPSSAFGVKATEAVELWLLVAVPMVGTRGATADPSYVAVVTPSERMIVPRTVMFSVMLPAVAELVDCAVIVAEPAPPAIENGDPDQDVPVPVAVRTCPAPSTWPEDGETTQLDAPPPATAELPIWAAPIWPFPIWLVLFAIVAYQLGISVTVR